LDVTKFSKLLVMLKQLEMTIHQDLENWLSFYTEQQKSTLKVHLLPTIFYKKVELYLFLRNKETIIYFIFSVKAVHNNKEWNTS
jgi:hypothetical protein